MYQEFLVQPADAIVSASLSVADHVCGVLPTVLPGIGADITECVGYRDNELVKLATVIATGMHRRKP